MVKPRKKYKYPEGVIGFPRAVLRSDAYSDLSTCARSLMLELQNVWRPFEANLHYSVRRAAKALGVANGTACNAFKELDEHGFIVCVDESDWFSGKARVWRLTWLTCDEREPSNEWAGWGKSK